MKKVLRSKEVEEEERVIEKSGVITRTNRNECRVEERSQRVQGKGAKWVL